MAAQQILIHFIKALKYQKSKLKSNSVCDTLNDNKNTSTDYILLICINIDGHSTDLIKQYVQCRKKCRQMELCSDGKIYIVTAQS